MEISQRRWMPEIFAMFEELKSQNQYLVEKVERLEEIVDKRPLALNTSEVAKILGYSVEYVRKLDRDGKMPKRVLKDGQRARWNRLDIEKMAKSKKITGHTDINILVNTYYNPTATEVAQRLRNGLNGA